MLQTDSSDRLEAVARAVADLVGDGCIVGISDDHDSHLHVAAVAHRDAERRPGLETLIGSSRSLSEWARQAYTKDVSFRLRHDAAAQLVRAFDVRAAALAPLRIDGARGVVVAVRDSGDFPYSAAEQQRVEALAAGSPPAATDLAARAVAAAPDRLLEHSPAAVWVTDVHGRTTYVNHAACELAGVPGSRLLGERLVDRLDGPGAALPCAAQASDRQDRLFRRPDGLEVWVSLASRGLTDGAGRDIGIVTTMIDVGERKQVEVDARLRATAYEAAAGLAERAVAGVAFDVLAADAVAMTADLLGADRSALIEVDRVHGRYITRAAAGWPRDEIRARGAVDDLSPVWLCLTEDEPVVLQDLERHDHVVVAEPGALERRGSGLWLAVGDGRGVLSAHSPFSHAFDLHDLGFLRLVAGVLAGRWEPRDARSPVIAGIC